MELTVRRVVTTVDDTFVEGGVPLERPLRVAVAAAVVSNPLAGQYVDDLGPFRAAGADTIGRLLCERLEPLVGTVEAYGKAALVGTAGEIEHGSVLIHTLQFGDHLRKLASGTTLLPAAEKRGAAGSPIDIPMKHVTDMTIRSHHMTYEFRIADAPHPDELVIIMAVADGGRPHARSGSLADEGSLPSAGKA